MSEMPLSFCDFVNKIPQTKVNKILYTFNISLAWLFFSWPHFNYCTESGRKKKVLFRAAYSFTVQGQGSGHVLALAFGVAVNPATPTETSANSLSALRNSWHKKSTPRPYRSSVRVWYCQWNPGQRNPLYVLIDYTCKGASDSQAGLCLQ